MKLRPHHLICTLGYEGKGYSEDFVRHMDAVTARLRTEENLPVEIVCSTDDICSHCPHMLGIDLCEKNDEVKAHDQKVFDALALEEREYAYTELQAIIRRKVSSDVLCYICGDCMWLPLTNCRSLLLDFLNANEK